MSCIQQEVCLRGNRSRFRSWAARLLGRCALGHPDQCPTLGWPLPDVCNGLVSKIRDDSRSINFNRPGLALLEDDRVGDLQSDGEAILVYVVAESRSRD